MLFLFRTSWLLIAVLLLYGGPPAKGQHDTKWSIQTSSGRSVPWSGVRAWPLDSLQHAALHALRAVQTQGYYFARIDSHYVEKTRDVRLFVTLGPQVTVGRIRIEGAVTMDSLILKDQMATRTNRSLDPVQLEADVQALLLHYTEAGFLLAEIAVAKIAMMEGDAPQLDIVLTINEGSPSTLHRVELQGASRTNPGHAARIAALHVGEQLVGYNPTSIQQRLNETTLFRSVELPELYLERDSLVVVRIPVIEEAPGAFDLALGYQPAPPGQRGGRLVGSGHLMLRNLFGRGRLLSLEIRRPPGQISRLNLRMADPWVLGLPLSIEGRFEGLQQDSTYSKRIYGMEVGYQFRGGLQVFSTFHREVTRPGLAGLEIRDGTQRIPLASGFFAGAGVRIRRLDNRINPRKGLAMEASVEQGRSHRQRQRVHTTTADTTSEQSQLRQERLHATLRLFIPTLRRQVLVVGGDASLLRSNEYDESDLFRLGGASSLRGYDEERFRAPFTARLLTEYRYQVDRSSYGSVFFDLGYVDASRTASAMRGFYPGFGVGFQTGTDIGLILLNLAANAENPTVVRAHIGLSVGL